MPTPTVQGIICKIDCKDRIVLRNMKHCCAFLQKKSELSTLSTTEQAFWVLIYIVGLQWSIAIYICVKPQCRHLYIHRDRCQLSFRAWNGSIFTQHRTRSLQCTSPKLIISFFLGGGIVCKGAKMKLDFTMFHCDWLEYFAIFVTIFYGKSFIKRTSRTLHIKN